MIRYGVPFPLATEPSEFQGSGILCLCYIRAFQFNSIYFGNQLTRKRTNEPRNANDLGVNLTPPHIHRPYLQPHSLLLLLATQAIVEFVVLLFRSL